MKRGVSSVDLGNQEADESQQEGEKNRDKSKGQKYKAMKDQLPEHVVDLIEKESCKKSSPREFKTQVIKILSLCAMSLGSLNSTFQIQSSKNTSVCIPNVLQRRLIQQSQNQS